SIVPRALTSSSHGSAVARDGRHAPDGLRRARTDDRALFEGERSVREAGRHPSDAEIERFLVSVGAVYEETRRRELIDRAAGLLAAEKVVGWFQGRMGVRAAPRSATGASSATRARP